MVLVIRIHLKGIKIKQKQRNGKETVACHRQRNGLILYAAHHARRQPVGSWQEGHEQHPPPYTLSFVADGWPIGADCRLNSTDGEHFGVDGWLNSADD